ncbi:hypothetical protein JOB18_001269 [Solea senegalensis]|uniref:Uncharacterized protein n=1 Tax=Solea senegalensis TaxID=28829 RepID=A0AAV6RVS6_SOLSE|nr:hypothetical protein JOB18_001269 [Solea senegalensis]
MTNPECVVPPGHQRPAGLTGLARCGLRPHLESPASKTVGREVGAEGPTPANKTRIKTVGWWRPRPHHLSVLMRLPFAAQCNIKYLTFDLSHPSSHSLPCPSSPLLTCPVPVLSLPLLTCPVPPPLTALSLPLLLLPLPLSSPSLTCPAPSPPHYLPCPSSPHYLPSPPLLSSHSLASSNLTSCYLAHPCKAVPDLWAAIVFIINRFQEDSVQLESDDDDDGRPGSWIIRFLQRRKPRASSVSLTSPSRVDVAQRCVHTGRTSHLSHPSFPGAGR